jgi:hypothetical protein
MNTDTNPESAPSAEGTNGGSESAQIGALLHRIGDDLKVIARDEVELTRDEIARGAQHAAADVGVTLLGAAVALIGLGMLCAVAVAALQPVIHALWARLLIMAIVYLVVGGVVAGGFAKRLGADVPHLTVPRHESEAVIAGAGEALAAKEAHRHA